MNPPSVFMQVLSSLENPPGWKDYCPSLMQP